MSVAGGLDVKVELTSDGKERLREIGTTLGGLWAGTRRREECPRVQHSPLDDHCVRLLPF